MNLFGEKIKDEFGFDFAYYNVKISDLIAPVYKNRPFDFFEIIQELIKLEKEVIAKTGKNKNRIEEQILEQISMLFIELSEDYKFDYMLLNDNLISDTKIIELQRFHALSLKIEQFARSIYFFNKINDNFSSLRKGFAIRLFCTLLFDYDINDKYELISNALRSGRSKLVSKTLYELNHLIVETRFRLSNDLIKMLYELIKKSNDRSVIIGCLDVLISIGKESEGSSLMIIDDWKYKNYDYR